MQRTSSLRAAKSWQAPPVTMQTGVYNGLMSKRLLCFLLFSVVALSLKLQVADGQLHPTDYQEQGNNEEDNKQDNNEENNNEQDNNEENNNEQDNNEENNNEQDNNEQVVPATEEVESPRPAADLAELECEVSDPVEGAEGNACEPVTDCTDVEETDGDKKKCCHIACKSRIKKLWGAIQRWWAQNLGPSKTCKEVKRAGGIPSVDKGHSPIESFGYPVFDTQTSRLFLQPRIPLSVVNGYMQPIKVGASDYIIRGSFVEIVAFLECFEDYEVIASALNADGRWVSAPGESNVALQLQNVDSVLYGPLEQNDRLFEMGLSMLTKVADSLRGELRASSAKKLSALLDMIQNIKEKAPLQDMPSLLESLSDCKAAEDVLKALWQYMQYIARGNILQEDRGWMDKGTVDLRGNLALTITSYPRPCHGVRATLVMPGNRATLREIRETLPGVFSSPSEERVTA